jgi:2',3'-cyclic-nucleotide 2'-phosphodiesterase
VSGSNSLTILFIADIVGKPGLDTVSALLPNLKKQYRLDLVIANGENGAHGKGLTETIARQYLNVGIDVITGGNHTWNDGQFRKYLDTASKVLRPLNYPHGVPGRGSAIVKSYRDLPVAVVNLQGRTFLYPIDCPFKIGMTEIERLKSHTPVIIVDFHAEATAEKMALAWYLDGHVSAVIGTHTHVQTADERILPHGTAYITDAGMTGPFDSVIGLEKDVAIKRFLYQLPEKYQVASLNNRLNGVVIEIDHTTGRAIKIIRINLP